tara:strand:- start:1475 stop:1705 length:231 start_codon:yes stop_codon:yes gene_type:complete
MGEAKRRKDLGLPPRKIDEDKLRREKGLPPKEIDKEKLKKNIKLTFSKYPFIPIIFYGLAIIVLIIGVLKIVNFYR